MMPKYSDYSIKSREAFFNLLNKENNLTRTLSDFDVWVGPPENITNPDAMQNTRITLYGLKQSGYKGSVTLTYRRRDIGVIFKNFTPTFHAFNCNSLNDLLPHFFADYGIELLESDIVNVEKTGEDWIETLKIDKSSLGWIGEIKVRYSVYIRNIDTIITDSNLTSIINPLPLVEDGNKDLEIISYGLDFTDAPSIKNLRAGGTLDTGGAYMYATELNAIFSNYKLVGLASNPINEHEIVLRGCVIEYNGPTQGYPLARQDMDNVVVVGKINSSPGFKGKLFLHYDLEV